MTTIDLNQFFHLRVSFRLRTTAGGSFDRILSIFDLDVLSGVAVSCLVCSEPGGWESELVDMVI